MEKLKERIAELKAKRKALILAHNYTAPEIQDIADFTGDSLELSRKAATCDAPVIVFCGVRFMAETAKLLNPAARVLHPNPDAGCPMADMVTADAIREYRKANPDVIVVAYVNTTAETKTEVDICCTSGNAEKIISALPRDRKILFVPDQNLGAWVRHECDRPDIELWPGFCPTHNKIMPYQLAEARKTHPGAAVMVHPECRPDVTEQADFVLSTGGMLNRPHDNSQTQWILGTESNMLHRIKQEYPDMNFYSLEPESKCPNMRKITLEDVLFCLEDMSNEVVLSEDVMAKAVKPIQRMLECSNTK